ncbi:helix-turn-helix domain-containing protein [Actinoallomurus oryzae]|uniref:helix-turn-helix domain-containing protein n=1 Tax=Actinoallomurus oryzae TaxID=502180 RepID=UPI0031EAF5A6
MSNCGDRSGGLDGCGAERRPARYPGSTPSAGDAACRASAHRRGALGGSNRLLTVAEVAEYLGIPKKTIYQCWRSWGFTAYKVGRHLRFRERDIESWLEQQEVRGV